MGPGRPMSQKKPRPLGTAGRRRGRVAVARRARVLVRRGRVLARAAEARWARTRRPSSLWRLAALAAVRRRALAAAATASLLLRPLRLTRWRLTVGELDGIIV